MHRLTDTLAIQNARLAIENIRREYPNAPGHVLGSADDLRAAQAAPGPRRARRSRPDDGDPGLGFRAWFDGFLPSVPGSLLEPAIVSDRSDPKTVHLDGLNFARAWSWRRVAEGLGDDPRARAAAAAGETHLDAALPYLFSGEYASEHLVTTFALLALSD